MEYPVGISYYAFGAAEVTHWLSGSPNLRPRGAMSQGQLYGDPDVLGESLTFTTVNVVGFGICALIAAWFLTGVHRRRPWDAALFAVSPVLLFEGLINWDLLAVACVAGALLAHSRGPARVDRLRDRSRHGAQALPALPARRAPDHLGAPAQVARPRWSRPLPGSRVWSVLNALAFLSGSHEWKVFWTFNAHRGADLGSVWLVAQQMGISTASAHTINVVSWIFFGLWCAGVAAIGVLAPRTPRLAQLGFLIVLGFLLVNKVYSPQYALWLLPLAVMARPRMRDQLIWQIGEIYYFASVWWYLGTYLDPSGGGDPGFYWLAVGIRIAAQLYLGVLVVRDLLMPEYDVVRIGRLRRAASLAAATHRAGASHARPRRERLRPGGRGVHGVLALAPGRPRDLRGRDSRAAAPRTTSCVARRPSARWRSPWPWANLAFGVASTVTELFPFSARHSLPLQICDLAWIFVAWALLTAHPLPLALTYYWGLTLSVQALVQPTLTEPFPDVAVLRVLGQARADRLGRGLPVPVAAPRPRLVVVPHGGGVDAGLAGRGPVPERAARLQLRLRERRSRRRRRCSTSSGRGRCTSWPRWRSWPAAGR